MTETLSSTISSPLFLLVAIILSFSVKIYFLSILIPQGLRAAKIQKYWIFLLGVLIGSMFGDIAWIVKLLRELWVPDASYSLVTFFIRIAWGFLIIQYQSLALFIESLTEKNFVLRTPHKILVFVGTSFSLYFFFVAFFDTSLTEEFERMHAKRLTTNVPLEIAIMRYVVYYLFNLLLFPSLYVTFNKLRYSNVPKILKKQLRLFIQFLILPYILVEFIQAFHFLFKSFESYIYTTVSISTVLLIYAIYYCMQRVMGLRFLNFHSHVQSEYTFNFMDDFKNVFEQLSTIHTTQELIHIVQTFFKEAFHVPAQKIIVSLRHTTTTAYSHQKQLEKNTVENFLRSHDQELCAFILKHRILIYDEIDFTHFYSEDTVRKSILTFLDAINADVFLPIYNKQKVIAYIIIEKHTRIREFYSNIERDQMLIFAHYLANILNLLQHQNIEPIIHEVQAIKDELIVNRQTVNLYKESIKSFLRTSKPKEIGIVFYKNRRFTLGNQAAKELIPININKQEGHPLTQALKAVAQQVEEYKTPQTVTTHDTNNNKLVLCGVPNLEHHNVIITAYYPEISDIITKHIALLDNPSNWDYLLYLETTQPGQLINQLIPTHQEQLLRFKIDLLKMALNPKTMLLDVPEDDVTSVVELLHRISNRDSLHIVHPLSQEKNSEASLKLFGVNNTHNNPAQALFKKLDSLSTGTLIIKNIEYVDITTQELLAEYIKNNEQAMSNKQENHVRIICSTQHNLQLLVYNNTFSTSLFEILRTTTLTFPGLSTLSEKELDTLIDGYAEQLLKTETFKSLLMLSPQEKNRIIQAKTLSLHELKTKIHQLFINKSKKHNLHNEIHVTPAYALDDVELLEASRLGKHALRDPKIMGLLWNKFKNQNQIAAFLGVNRSSVNRRCKDYNLA